MESFQPLASLGLEFASARGCRGNLRIKLKRAIRSRPDGGASVGNRGEPRFQSEAYPLVSVSSRVGPKKSRLLQK